MILEWREDKGETQGWAMCKGQEWQETRLEVKEESPCGALSSTVRTSELSLWAMETIRGLSSE